LPGRHAIAGDIKEFLIEKPRLRLALLSDGAHFWSRCSRPGSAGCIGGDVVQLASALCRHTRVAPYSTMTDGVEVDPRPPGIGSRSAHARSW
jgi:hypothetical protein